MFLVISPIKLGRFWWNLVHSFPDKFAIKWCQRFPPHLNNVSTLHCKTWNAHRTRSTIALLDRETPELSHLNCGLQIRHIWIKLITACRKYCNRSIQHMRHWSAAIYDATDEWLLQWWCDPARSTPFSVAVSVHPDQWCVFCTSSLAVFRHAVINLIQIWRIWRP